MDIRLALTGFGNVGLGVAELLAEQEQRYGQYGIRMILTGVADRGGAVVSSEGLDPRRLLDVKREHGTVASYDGGEPGLEGTSFLDRAGAHVLFEAASTNFED